MTPRRLTQADVTEAQRREAATHRVPCPYSQHAHDCDCRTAPDGSWLLDPACGPRELHVREPAR